MVCGAGGFIGSHLMIMKVADKGLVIRHVPGPLGVKGRNSDNQLIEEMLGWKPTDPLMEGLRKTYPWVAEQVAASTFGADISRDQNARWETKKTVVEK